MAGLIEMTSPNGDTTVRCHPDRVEYMKANGWSKKTAPTKPAKAVKKGDE